jgi:hypothetical protein
MNTLTKSLGILTLTASALASTHVFAAPKADAGDTRLTLTGCVVAGEGKDSFLLTNTMVEGNAPNNAFYRLDSTKKLKDQVGHRVEITGTADFADMDKGKVKVKTDDKGKTTTSVTSERKTVKVEDNVWFGTTGATKLRADIATYGFEVKNVKRLEGNCAK